MKYTVIISWNSKINKLFTIHWLDKNHNILTVVCDVSGRLPSSTSKIAIADSHWNDYVSTISTYTKKFIWHLSVIITHF